MQTFYHFRRHRRKKHSSYYNKQITLNFTTGLTDNIIFQNQIGYVFNATEQRFGFYNKPKINLRKTSSSNDTQC